jgi:hypothetical protein
VFMSRMYLRSHSFLNWQKQKQKQFECNIDSVRTIYIGINQLAISDCLFIYLIINGTELDSRFKNSILIFYHRYHYYFTRTVD